MTPREKTDLRNRISEEATKRFWGREVHYLASSVADVIDSMPETARQLLAEIILLKQELEDYKQRTDLAIRYTFDLLMTGDLSNQQRLMINQIKDSLSDK